MILILLGSTVATPVLSSNITEDQDQDQDPLHERIMDQVRNRIRSFNMSRLGQELGNITRGLKRRVGLSSSSSSIGGYSSSSFTTFEESKTSVPTRIWEIIRGGSFEYFNETKKGGEWIEEFNRKVRNDEPINWILEIRGDIGQGFASQLEELGATILHKDQGIDAISIEAKPSIVEDLLVNPTSLGLKDKFRIEAIWPDLYVANNYYTSNIGSSIDISSSGVSEEAVDDPSWNIDRVNADLLWSKKGNTGDGSVVAVVDTGVDKNHKMLNNSVIGTKNFVETEENTDLNGHGTHVASAVAGKPVPIMRNGNTTYISGVAPSSSILGVKVLGETGGGSMTNVLEGLDYVVEYHEDNPETPLVITLSLGSPLAVGSTPMMDKVNRVVNRHKIPVVAAAGNTYIGINSPGTSEKAYTVAAINKENKVATYSSRGPSPNPKELIKPDISAPGSSIVGAKAGSPDELIFMSGTSMATPHVAGGMALLLSKDPNYSPKDLQKILSKSADPLSGLDSLETWSGAGVLDVYEASSTSEDYSSFSNWLNDIIPFNLNLIQIIFMEEINKFRPKLETMVFDYIDLDLENIIFSLKNGG